MILHIYKPATVGCGAHSTLCDRLRLTARLVAFPSLLMTDLLHNLQVPPSNVRSK